MTRFTTSKTISFVNLRAQYDALKPAIDAAIADVLNRSAYISGAEVDDFEQWFGTYCGVRHAVGVSSGTRALELVLRGLRICDGDEVITSANTFIATAAAITAAGAHPVLVDVEESTGNLDPNRLEHAITNRTKAIIPVHLYGRPAAMEEVLDVAHRHQLAVVEDAAQAHGARFRGARVGSRGTAGCFSFYPTKNLGAFGDAGMVTTNDDELVARIRLLRDHGRVTKFEHNVVGYTARLDTLQAAVLRVQADKLDEWNARRRDIAKCYQELLPGDVRYPKDDPRDESVYHLFVVRVPRRDELRAHLAAQGIATGVHYPVPVHLQPAYRELGYSVGAFPITERLTREIVSLPMHPFLTRGDVQDVAAAVADFLSRC
ncbi:MAG TPA: DegT/DnrJ/EryC1/StrS family aminotransferase [Vicinamibacterales bacterium]|nr:DegT/DnrJ/EryC1/StrS family aminotransferase [Vicinamibacterales bacterium]